MEEMTNVAMLAVTPPVPQNYWDWAMTYSSDTRNFNFSKPINTSPYKYETGYDIDIRKVHGYFDKVWILIPHNKRDGKVGSPRASKGVFLGYHLQDCLYDLYYILNITAKGHYGSISLSKDVLFDNNIILHVSLPEETPYDREFADPESFIPFHMRETAPLQLKGPESRLPRITEPVSIVNSDRVLRSNSHRSIYAESLPSAIKDKTPKQDLAVRFSDEVNIDD